MSRNMEETHRLQGLTESPEGIQSCTLKGTSCTVQVLQLPKDTELSLIAHQLKWTLKIDTLVPMENWIPYVGRK